MAFTVSITMESFFSQGKFLIKGPKRINEYLKEWESTGLHASTPGLDACVEYQSSTSTFDTDPFEPNLTLLGIFMQILNH